MFGDNGPELRDPGTQPAHRQQQQQQPFNHLVVAKADLRDPRSEGRRLELLAQFPDHETCASDWHQQVPHHVNRDCSRQAWRQQYPATREYQQIQEQRERRRREREAARPRQATGSLQPRGVVPSSEQQEITQGRRRLQQLEEERVQAVQEQQTAKRARTAVQPAAAEHLPLATAPVAPPTTPMPSTREAPPVFHASGSHNVISVHVHQAPVTNTYAFPAAANMGALGWSGGAGAGNV